MGILVERYPGAKALKLNLPTVPKFARHQDGVVSNGWADKNEAHVETLVSLCAACVKRLRLGRMLDTTKR